MARRSKSYTIPLPITDVALVIYVHSMTQDIAIKLDLSPLLTMKLTHIGKHLRTSPNIDIFVIHYFIK